MGNLMTCPECDGVGRIFQAQNGKECRIEVRRCVDCWTEWTLKYEDPECVDVEPVTLIEDMHE